MATDREEQENIRDIARETASVVAPEAPSESRQEASRQDGAERDAPSMAGPRGGAQDERDGDVPDETRNRVFEGPATLEQVIFNAGTINNPNATEQVSIAQVQGVKDELIAARSEGISVDTGTIRISGSGADPSLVKGAVEIEVDKQRAEAQREQQMQDAARMEQERKDEAQREEDAKKAQQEAQETMMAIQEVIAGTAFVGSDPLEGVGKDLRTPTAKLPKFLKDAGKMAGLSPEAMEAATAAGSKVMGLMGGFLGQSQSMGLDALCQDTHHGLSTTGKQRQVEAGIT